MDFIGWFLFGILGALFLAASLWGRRDERKRAAGARSWATSRGLVELPFDKEGVPGDLAVKRRQSLPSFVGLLDGLEVSVIASRTTPRRGHLWALCTRARLPPIFLGSVFDFSTASLFGKATPAGWVHVSAGAELDRHFFASIPRGDVVPALTPDAIAALIDASVHAFSFNANPSGFTVLWFKQTYGQDTEGALSHAARLLARLVA